METIGFDLRQMQRTPLSDKHVEALRVAGVEKTFPEGTMVGVPGQTFSEFFYLLDGEIEVVDPITLKRRLPSTLGSGQFMGEIQFLNGGSFSMAMRAARDTRVIAVERRTMLNLMSRIPEMSDIIISVFSARRRRQLEDKDSSLKIIGADRSRELREIAAFAERNRIPFQQIDLDSEEASAEARACAVAIGRPVVIFGSGQAIEDPTPERVAEVLGLELEVGEDEIFDVLIVGGGPAGVAAGVYAGAEGLSGVVVEDIAVGGQAGTSSRIENYMGFPTGISGADLVWRGEVQAMKFGTRFVMPRRVVSLEKREDGLFCATMNNGKIICARAVVVATGVQYRKMPIDRLADFEGAGVYYAATESEARWCRKAEVAIIGGGNSAGQAAMYLSRIASHVHLIVRGDSLAASMSSYLSNRLEADPAITIHYQSQVTGLGGGENLETITVLNKANDKTRTMDVRGLFIMVGAAPNTGWLSGLVKLDNNGFVLTGADAGVDGGSPHQTSMPGIFAVGDVRAGSVKRVASAVGEGSVVISKVWEHVRA